MKEWAKDNTQNDEKRTCVIETDDMESLIEVEYKQKTNEKRRTVIEQQKQTNTLAKSYITKGNEKDNDKE